MSLNDTPSGERTHLAFFGVRNAGKSSLVNALTNQTVSVVSDTAGTTTDPVRKAMELLPVGPVLVIDTPGIDDEGDLGNQRVARATAVLDAADVAVLVVDATRGMTPFDEQLVTAFQQRRIPYVIAENKADLLDAATPALAATIDEDKRGCRRARVRLSAATGAGMVDLKGMIAALVACVGDDRHLVADLLEPGDVVVLVIPLDSAAPKGRIILPQQQVLRDVLEAGAFPCATSVEALPQLLDTLTCPPRFDAVAELLPATAPLTSFSILMARYKGDLPAQLQAVHALENLTDGDVVLIAEGCTHHRTCEDIGMVKLPQWIREICGANRTSRSPRGAISPTT